MIPEYFKGWWVATTRAFPTDDGFNYTKWVARQAQRAASELREVFKDNKGLCVSAIKYPDKDSIWDAHSEGWSHLYLDFDGNDPNIAKADAIKAVNYFRESLTVPDEHIQVYFSGNKGYHVFVNASVFGIKPMIQIHKFYEYIATTLRDRLSLTTLDLSIYNRSRQFRVANSIHEKSGRYRLPISIKTLLNKSHEDILSCADRPGLPPSEFKYVANPEPLHEAFYKTAMEAFQKKETAKPISNTKDVPYEVWGKVPGLPTCIQDMLDRFITSGYRFPAIARIVAYYKVSGSDKEDIIEILEEKIRENYRPSEVADRIEKTRSSVNQIYHGDYTFNCAFALSLTKFAKAEDKIKCSGAACPLYTHCGSGKQEMDIVI